MPDADAARIARELLHAGVFDGDWYLRHYQDVAARQIDPLVHFVHWGLAEDRAPNRYFDPVAYRAAYPDSAGDGISALQHYLRYGEAEGRRPHPQFDPAWYRTAYRVPAGESCLGHFITHRTHRPLSPGPGLFAVPFIAPYRDHLAAGRDPVEHYLDDMERQGKEAFPDPAVIAASGLLDENDYLINGFDVHEAGVDPVDHYCRFGWREQRRPNLYFDPVWYTRTNPDLARLQVNPLLHYILVGEAADRRPVPFFDPAWYRRHYRVPRRKRALAHFLAHRRAQTVSPTPLFDVDRYVSRFGSEIGSGRDPFAHYLQAGMTQDIDPGPAFDAAAYRRTHLGRPSRGFAAMMRPDLHHPLVHHLSCEYAAAPAEAEATSGRR